VCRSGRLPPEIGCHSKNQKTGQRSGFGTGKNCRYSRFFRKREKSAPDLETNDEENYAKGKLEKKNLDLVVLNSLNDKGAGFKSDTNKITIFNKALERTVFETKSKTDVAKDICAAILKIAK
jgi:phosphopantothenoylcysteine synthetase/decarboxylase